MNARARFHSLHLAILLLFLLLAVRLLMLHVLDRSFLLRHALKQHRLYFEIAPMRGKILDRRGRELAVSIAKPSIYAVPRAVPPENRVSLARELARTFQVSEKDMLARLGRDKLFVWVKRMVSFEEAKRVEMFPKGTVGVTVEKQRVYPYGETASSILGLCDIDGKGIEGLEAFYDRQLAGQSGFRQLLRDGRGRPIFGREETHVPPRDGHDIQLGIDAVIQHLLERELKNVIGTWKAKSAWGVVLDPVSGCVLAMATVPGRDPNVRSGMPRGVLRNRAVVDFYEPGSVFKIVTASAALEEQKVKWTDTFHCGNGVYQRGKHILHDVHPYGQLDFPSVFVKSSNIGTVKIAEATGSRAVYETAKRFGFGEATGIDFPSETSGFLRPVAQWSKTSLAAIPIGQEVTVSAVQLAGAYAVLANGGALMRPYLLERVLDRDSTALYSQGPRVVRRVISLESAQALREILRRAVEEGTGQKAKVPGIVVGGKTGTAQKLEDDPKKGYSHSKFLSSFVGIAPIENPRLTMAIMVDEPKGAYYGGTVAAPVFKAVVEEALPYLGYAFPESVRPRELAGARAREAALPIAPQNEPPALRPLVRQA